MPEQRPAIQLKSKTTKAKRSSSRQPIGRTMKGSEAVAQVMRLAGLPDTGCFTAPSKKPKGTG